MRLTLAERYERDATARADAMLADEQQQQPEDRFRLPANMAQPGPVHLAIMHAVDRVLTMGLSHPNAPTVPAGLRVLVRSMRRLEPLMLEQLATVPERECVVMMRTLGAGILQLADEVDRDGNSAQSRPNQPTGA